MDCCWNALRAIGLALIIGFAPIAGASAQSPIRIGLSLALTGAGAAPSKVINTALEMWRDDVNAKGGLLGRPLELVIYDDQSAPANVPNIYTKLIQVDKVDLLLGPYGTNFVAPAMPTIIQNNKMTISFTAIGINDQFRYPKYFSMVSETPIKVQLGPVANGLIVGENFAAALAPKIPGSADFLKRYAEKAAAAQIDPLGFAWGPFAYSAGQTLAQAVTATKSLDHDTLAAYMHNASFKTVSGDFSFGKDGEWAKSRMVWTQVQNAQPNNLDQFRDGKAQPIVWPPDARTGTLIYPYEKARQN